MASSLGMASIRFHGYWSDICSICAREPGRHGPLTGGPQAASFKGGLRELLGMLCLVQSTSLFFCFELVDLGFCVLLFCQAF